MFKTVLNFGHLKIRICFEFRYSNFKFIHNLETYGSSN